MRDEVNICATHSSHRSSTFQTLSLRAVLLYCCFLSVPLRYLAKLRAAGTKQEEDEHAEQQVHPPCTAVFAETAVALISRQSASDCADYCLSCLVLSVLFCCASGSSGGAAGGGGAARHRQGPTTWRRDMMIKQLGTLRATNQRSKKSRTKNIQQPTYNLSKIESPLKSC